MQKLKDKQLVTANTTARDCKILEYFSEIKSSYNY